MEIIIGIVLVLIAFNCISQWIKWIVKIAVKEALEELKAEKELVQKEG